jgi:hypothetical protein
MDERETDKRLGELFERNAPDVNEPLLRERITGKLPRRRRRSRRARTARMVAVGFASIVLLGGVAFGAYRMVTYFQGGQTLVITDSTLAAGDTGPSGTGTANTSVLAGLVPVAGTATLERVKSEGTATQERHGDYASRVTGRELVFWVETSQPGVSGTLEITSDLDVRADCSADVRATWILSNDQGAWQCASSPGYLTADGAEQFGFGKAAGTGGYEGMTLYLQWHSTQEPDSAISGAESSGSILVTGWIQSAE